MKQLFSVSIALLVSLTFLVLLLFFMGEDLNALSEALQHTFLNRFGLGYTLFYTTPLIFTGLSVALCFHAGLFNIGAEGQLLWGAIAIVAFSRYFPNLPPWSAIPLSFVVAALAGSLWGFLPGYFKAKRGTHEVITTILLNFIALSCVNYLILYPFKNPESQSAETSVLPAGYQLQTLWFPTTPVNVSLIIAIAVAIAVYVLLFRTSFGFELRTMGQSPRAAVFSGVLLSQRTLAVFMISGALAGLVATNDILGNEHKLIEGFSPGYGFTGIAVALLARNHPIGIIFSSFLFGSLQNFSRELEFFSQNISKEVSLILQAILIILVSTRDFWQRRRLK
ncbi:MAG: ABC transporter permease [Proteobacteria bacterium]|nr:ABC transporter permease [Pseudomonadota bacterium]